MKEDNKMNIYVLVFFVTIPLWGTLLILLGNFVIDKIWNFHMELKEFEEWKAMKRYFYDF